MTFLDALEQTILDARSSNVIKCLGDQSNKGSLIWQFCMYNRKTAASFGLRLKGHSTRLRVFYDNQKLTNDMLKEHIPLEWIEFLLDKSTYENKQTIKGEMLNRLDFIKDNKSVEDYRKTIQ